MSEEQKLSLMIKNAVDTAMKNQPGMEEANYTCPGCNTVVKGVSAFIDHKFLETYLPKIKEESKIPTAAEILAAPECKDGICKIIDTHLKETYNVMKKGEEEPEEEEPGLFTLEDEKE